MNDRIDLDKSLLEGPKSLRDDPVIRYGGIAVVSALVIFLLWAVAAPLAQGVVASGTVSVNGKRKTIQHLEGGIIATIHVREGDMVERGQPLVDLDDIQSRSRRDLVHTRYYAAATKLDRLKTERENKDTIHFADEIMARAADPGVAELLDEQISIFKVRKAQLDGQILIYKQRVKQLAEKVSGLGVQKKAQQTSLALVKDELERSLPLYEEGIVDLPTISALKRRVAEIEGEIGRIASEESSARVEKGEAELEIIQIRKIFDEQVSTEIIDTQEQYYDLKEQLGAVEDILKRTRITSPLSGTVLGLRFHTIGGVVPPGEPILDIVPNDDQLVIEARVRTIDIDNVTVDQPVRVRFSAFKQRTLPYVTGTVITVAPDTVIDNNTKQPYYLANIMVADEELARLGDVDIVPGMPADILIEGESRTLFTYLLDPIDDVVEKGLKEE